MWRRAILCLKRKLKMTCLLLFVLLIILSSLITSISIYRRTQVEIEEMNASYGSAFCLKAVEYADMFEYYTDDRTGQQLSRYIGPLVTDEIIDKILKVPGVKEVCTESQISNVTVNQIELLPGMFAQENKAVVEEKEDNPEWYKPEYLVKHNRLQGFNKSELCSYFKTGTLELKEGRHIKETDIHKVLISDTLAEKNQLKIGESISIEINEYGVSHGDPDKALAKSELEIVGIYHVNTLQIISEFTAESDILENYMLVDLKTVYEFDKAVREENNIGGEPVYMDAVFFVDNPKNLEKIIDDVKLLKGIEWNCFDIQIDDSTYQSALKSMEILKKIVIFMIICTIIVLLILVMIVAKLWMKIRCREIGILLVLGFEKKDIVGQNILEVGIVFALALATAMLISATLTTTVGNSLLASINSRTKEQREIEEYYLATEPESTQEIMAYLEQIEVKVEMKPVEKIEVRIVDEAVIISGVIVMIILFGTIIWETKKYLIMKPRELLTLL